MLKPLEPLVGYTTAVASSHSQCSSTVFCTPFLETFLFWALASRVKRAMPCSTKAAKLLMPWCTVKHEEQLHKPQGLYTDESSKGLQLVLAHQMLPVHCVFGCTLTNDICAGNSTRPTESTGNSTRPCNCKHQR